MSLVPGDDLVLPTHEGPIEGTDLGWRLPILEIELKPSHEVGADTWLVELLDRPHDFLCAPGHAHLAVGVTSPEKPGEAALRVVKAFMCLREQPPCPVERVLPAATVPELLVLNPASAIVEMAVGVR